MTDPEVLQRRFERERKARQEAEKLLEDKSRELYLANQELTEALGKLHTTQAQLVQNEKMASIGQMAAGVAHEINNPIGFIASNLGSLRQYVVDLKRVLAADNTLIDACEVEDERVRAAVTDARTARREVDLDFILEDLENLVDESLGGADRVKKIVADLRDFSHVDSPDVVEVDLNDLIEKTISVASHELKYKVEVVREYGRVPNIPCHGGKVGQIILNMLINSVQAIEDRGTITVRTGVETDAAWFEVEDTGSGIEEEHLSRIFEPFFTTKDVGKGTGLGLHLTHKIVQAHGGQIDVHSTVGEGTRFRVALPLSGPPDGEAERSGASAA